MFMQAKPIEGEQFKHFISLPSSKKKRQEELDLCTVRSEHTDLYKEKMEHFANLIDQEDDKSAFEKLKECGILYKKYYKVKKDMELSVKSQSINREVIVVIAKFGQFEMEIKILNIQGENNKHNNLKSKGGHGNIYQGSFLSKQFAMKCIPIRSKSARRNAIAEWFIAKIASVFEFGPNIENIFGFDILMYQTCIEFPMQICKAVDYNCVNVNTLFWNLALIHSLHLVHCDIKLQNIMLSPSYKKIVFIDFGLSTFVSQSIGFKSFTFFVGDIQFCSLQMSKCLLNTSATPIDLYYNDLCCLQGTFKLVSSTKIVPACQKQQQMSQFDFESEWFYLITYKLKLYLYMQRIESFFVVWNSVSLASSIQRQKKNILLFLQQLYPTKELKEFFWKFITDSEVDSDHCSRIKLIYEISQENLCSVQMLTNREKNQYFTAFFQEFMTEQQVNQKIESNKKKAIVDLIVNPSAVRNLWYLDQVDIYLQYMSYMSNKFSVNAAKREEAAKVYYSVHISPKMPQDINGRKITQLTIRHILRAMFKITQLQENASLFAIFSFRLYVFIVILDIGSPQQVINWLDCILNHFCSEYYKYAFIQWVKDSNYFQENRIVKKEELSRVQFIQIISKWVLKNENQLQKKSQKIPQKYSQSKIFQSESKEDYPFSQQFMDQFGYLVVFESKFFRSKRNYNLSISKDKDIEYLNQIMKSKTPRWSFFMLKLLQFYYVKRNSPTLCNKIYNAFKSSICDQSILKEFSFQFKNKVFFQMLSTQNFNIKNSCLEQAVNYLSQINSSDLVLFYTIVTNIYNKLMVKNKFGANLKQFLSEKKLIFYRFIESLANHLASQLYGSLEEHVCIVPSYLCDLATISKQLIYKQVEIKEMFSWGKSDYIKCQHCQKIVKASLLLRSLSEKLTEYIQRIQSMSKLPSQESVKELFNISKKVIDLIESYPFQQPYRSQIVSIALRICQLVCCLEGQIQDKYHGIQNYYEFTSKCNKIDWFLQSQYQNSFPIYQTLIVLQRKGEGKHIQFMFKLAQCLEKSLLYKDYLTIVFFCKQFFSRHSEEELQILFRDLKKQSILHPENHYFSIIFSILLSITSRANLQRAAVSAIIKVFPKLHYRFQRQIAMHQYFTALKLLSQRSDRRAKRQWLFCNNKLVKQLNAIGSSLPQKKRSKINSKRDLLISKMRKIEKITDKIRYKMK